MFTVERSDVSPGFARGVAASWSLQQEDDVVVEHDIDCRYRSAINRPKYGTMKFGQGEQVAARPRAPQSSLAPLLHRVSNRTGEDAHMRV